MPTKRTSTFIVFCADADGFVRHARLIEAPSIDDDAVKAVCVEVCAEASDDERVFIAHAVVRAEASVTFTYV